LKREFSVEREERRVGLVFGSGGGAGEDIIFDRELIT